MPLRFLTAGESHGPALTAILEGLPAGLAVDREALDRFMARRQAGFGSGGRMKIERDRARISAGVLDGRTTGAPVALEIRNRDHAAWADREIPPMTIPRPGHADLSAAVKYGYGDLRLALERASARETAARVAVGALCAQLLGAFGIRVGSYVVAIGEVAMAEPEEARRELGGSRESGATGSDPALPPGPDDAGPDDVDPDDVDPDDASPDDASPDNVGPDYAGPDYTARFTRAEASELRCPDPEASERMRAAIEAAIRDRDTLGGVFEVVALGLPPGLGSHVHWDRRLGGRLAGALASIQAVKGIEIGPAFENARRRGTGVHDRFGLDPDGRTIRRVGNRAGGIEGGISTGEPLVLRAAMKPISTTLRPLASVDLATGEPAGTRYERSDFCAVPRAAVVGEAMVAFVLADALMEKLGGDSLAEMRPRFETLRRNDRRDLPMDAQPWRFGYADAPPED